MASEVRVNQIQNRSGLGTITVADSGVVISGITTISDLRTSGGALTVGTGASISSPVTNVLTLGTNNVERVRVDSNGHTLPGADNTYDLGASGTRWRNIYTADLQMSNEGSKNDVDGTWGKYTIQEGENDLFLINRRTGKRYKFLLEEVK